MTWRDCNYCWRGIIVPQFYTFGQVHFGIQCIRCYEFSVPLVLSQAITQDEWFFDIHKAFRKLYRPSYLHVWITHGDHLNHFFSATSIKSQVCEVVRVIQKSLYQIHALFYCDNDSGEKEFQGQMFSHYRIDNLASFYIHVFYIHVHLLFVTGWFPNNKPSMLGLLTFFLHLV